MAKIVQFWTSRNKMFRTGILWALILQIIRVPFLYINQNIGFDSLQTANYVNIGYKFVCFLEAAAFVWAFFGLIGQQFGKINRIDPGVKVADGVWMVKK